jgi:hypothetical protein
MPYRDVEPYERLVTSDVTDPDGYVRRVVIDWGDGTPPTTLTNDAACDDGDGRHYPVLGPFQAGYPVSAEHVFQRLGDVRVTLTYVSTGCDGTDEQTATETVDVFIESID